MQFYSGVIVPLIVEPLRYHFSVYTKDKTNLFWDPDEKLRTIEIGEAFDFNKVPMEEKPRVLVSRGQYTIAKTGLTDNLAEAKPMTDTLGLKHHTNMLFYTGTATITVEARNKGTCELIVDMVSHFIAWTRPTLCDSNGWKEFGLPMNVSDLVSITDENNGLARFQANILIPWIKEEQWRFRTDGFILKNVVTQVQQT